MIGVAVLAITLLALIALRQPEPIPVIERGYLQAAQLVHMARWCMNQTGLADPQAGFAASQKYTQCLTQQLNNLASLNATYPLYMYPTSLSSASCALTVSGQTLTLTCTTTFQLATPLTRVSGQYESVAVTVTLSSAPTGRTYKKQVGEKLYSMIEFDVTYSHSYATPFFTASLCPRVKGDSLADVAQTGSCKWLIAVPSEKAAKLPSGAVKFYYVLRDEYGVPVYVLGG